jgi:hypothetical protein
MRLHDSPKDKQSRDEAVQLILRRVAVSLGCSSLAVCSRTRSACRCWSS